MQSFEFNNVQQFIDKFGRSENLDSLRVIGFGESSHGAHDFFKIKTNSFLKLAKNNGYRYFALEDNPKSVEAVDRYVKGQDSDIRSAMKRLYRVWQVEELKNFFEKLRFEVKNGLQVDIVGIDVDQISTPVHKRDELMARNVLELAESGKTFLWAHNAHIRKQTDKRFSWQPLGSHLSRRLTKGYLAIGQYFDKGTFSAVNINENKPADNRHNLATQKLHPSSKSHIEYFLAKKYVRACFDTADLDMNFNARSFGWV